MERAVVIAKRRDDTAGRADTEAVPLVEVAGEVGSAALSANASDGVRNGPAHPASEVVRVEAAIGGQDQDRPIDQHGTRGADVVERHLPQPVAVRNAHEVEVAAASTDRNHSM